MLSSVSAPSAGPVCPDDETAAVATLVSAFTDDPVERWLYPDLQEYQQHFPGFVRALGGRAFATQSAWSLPGCSAVALWLPPGTEPDGDAIVSGLAGSVAPEKHDEMFDVLGQMGTAHPQYPHWYLPWFGVDAARQGRGLGSQLMPPCLAAVDRDHLPAYLETPNPRSIPFYQRHGFEVTGHAQAGSCPPLTFMLRSAR
jgi:GNAT superfamily N-acetyltransferase